MKDVFPESLGPKHGCTLCVEVHPTQPNTVVFLILITIRKSSQHSAVVVIMVLGGRMITQKCRGMCINVHSKYKDCPKCPSVNEWIKKLWYLYTAECYAAERKKELLPFTTAWMELESIMLSEVNQAVKDKYHMISPTSGT